MIAGNFYDLFRKPVALSRDREPTLLLPLARVEGVDVVAAKRTT